MVGDQVHCVEFDVGEIVCVLESVDEHRDREPCLSPNRTLGARRAQFVEIRKPGSCGPFVGHQQNCFVLGIMTRPDRA